MGFFQDIPVSKQAQDDQFILVQEELLPRCFYSDEEWDEICKMEITNGSITKRIPRPVSTGYFDKERI